jgi:uncharacterized protein
MSRFLPLVNRRLNTRVAATFAIAAAGGTLFTALALPAGWISGSLLAVAIASLSGIQTEVPSRLRPIIFLFLGIIAGSGAGPETLEEIVTWPASFAILAVSVALVVLAGYAFLHRVSGWDRQTALFASLPGALALVIAAAEATRADQRKVAVSQSMRVLILVQAIPLIVFVLGVPASGPLAGSVPLIGLADMALLIAAGTVGGFLLHMTGLPGGLMLGGLVTTAALYLSGTVTGALPQWLLIPGFVALGAVSGSRFRPGDRPILLRILGPALASFLIAAGISFAGAAVVTLALGVDLAQTLLAFAPGALEALTVLAFTMNADPAYVAAHHTARFVALALIVPFLARHLMKRV